MASRNPASPRRGGGMQTNYAAVPQSPQTAHYAHQHPQQQQQQQLSQLKPYQSGRSRTHSAGSSAEMPLNPTAHSRPNENTTQGVFTGHIGGGFGPYAFQQAQEPHQSVANPRFSHVSEQSYAEKPLGPPQQTTTVGGPAYLWDTRDPDLDDALHNPDPRQNAVQDSEWTLWSARGWANYFTLFAILFGLIILFAGYPIIAYYRLVKLEQGAAFNIGGINLTGQVPDLNIPFRIDKDTPEAAYTRTGSDGNKYNLVFSDEFNVDGRTFYPGDDPFWEAVDFHYWPTVDIEWYDPGQATTEGGHLVLEMVQERNHDMNFKSGMIQSWNKFCFTGGYIEVSISLPGSPNIPGFWPGAWTMGNLGRAGYGATTEGLWPYSYDQCDVGTFPNQTRADNTPAAALTGNAGGDGPISYLPGQRLSACTCPGSDHPGPRNNAGRSAPEIDILEAQINTDVRRGEVSQSVQIAPFDYAYDFPIGGTATQIFDTEKTVMNTYKGGIWQQALSGLTLLPDASYQDTQGQFSTYGFEYWPSRGGDGFITWFVDGERAWRMTNDALAANARVEIGPRLIPEEPMYIILNFGMSPGFQAQDFQHLVFPSKMLIDYVRIYQRDGHENWGCDPSDHPTAQYIQDHLNAYTNPNWTTWNAAGYTFPRNSQYDGC